MKKRYILLGLVLLVFSLGCTKEKEDNEEDYIALMKENEYVIVDVRTKEEYDEGHVKGAINIPYDEIDKDVALDKEDMIFVYCKSGGRSKIAYDTLKKLGFDVYDLGAYKDIDLEKE